MGLSETKETPSPEPTEIPTVQPQEQKSQSSWVITDIKTGLKSEILTNQGGQVHPKEETKIFLEVVGMFSRADNIEQPVKVDEVFVTQEKTTYKVTGIGLMSGSECTYFTGRIVKGSLGLETSYGSIKIGRKEEAEPTTIVLKKSPSQLCFACIVPKDLKGDLSFHFADVLIPISIK